MNSKKITYSLTIVMIILSCNRERFKEYMIFKGTIKNKKTDRIWIAKYGEYDSDAYVDTIELNQDGSFVDTLHFKKPGPYVLSNNNWTDWTDHWMGYFKKGSQLQLTLDAKDIKNTLNYTGDGADINNYLNKKKYQGNYYFYTNYNSLPEKEFKNKINDLKTAQERYLYSFKKIPEDFKKLEKKDIFYKYINTLEFYQKSHCLITKDTMFKVSDSFIALEKKIRKNIDYNNARDYDYSLAYRHILNDYYRKKTIALDSVNNTDKYLAYLKILATIPNQTIKNEMAYDAAKIDMTFTHHLEDYYNTFMRASTNKVQKKVITQNYSHLKKLAKGQISPVFTDYENYNGDKTSLSDFKGKYVYIDVWATWCIHCIEEIPYLKKIEKSYRDKNIAFISISLDEQRGGYNAWKKMIAQKQMKGIQLIADQAFKSDFIKQYMIMGIPHFILIDPQGNILNSNAPRPSQHELKKTLDEIL